MGGTHCVTWGYRGGLVLVSPGTRGPSLGLLLRIINHVPPGVLYQAEGDRRSVGYRAGSQGTCTWPPPCADPWAFPSLIAYTGNLNRLNLSTLSLFIPLPGNSSGGISRLRPLTCSFPGCWSAVVSPADQPRAADWLPGEHIGGSRERVKRRPSRYCLTHYCSVSKPYGKRRAGGGGCTEAASHSPG